MLTRITRKATDMSNESDDVVRILQITDFHFRAQPGDRLLGLDTEETFRDTLASALADGRAFDIALLTGDLAQDAAPATYLRLKERLSVLPCPAYCLPGNHDDPALMASVLVNDRLHCEARILLDYWQILCFDSTLPGVPVGRLAPAQLDLMESFLDDQPRHHALIALHHHPVPSGSAWMDTMQLENSAEFFARLKGYPQVRGIVFGHVHQTMDREHQGLRILGTPSTCFQFKPAQAEFTLDPVPSGYRWIELHPDGQIRSRIGRATTLPAGLNIASHGY